MWQSPEFMRRIGTVLRVKDDDFAHEALPERWVDLIHYLDEKERQESRKRNKGPTAARSYRGFSRSRRMPKRKPPRKED